MVIPRFVRCRVGAVVIGSALLSAVSLAESHDPADYPLRLPIFKLSSQVHRRHGIVWWVEGNGRANLFENGNPAGVDFAYHCGDRFMDSSGDETSPRNGGGPANPLSS